MFVMIVLSDCGLFFRYWVKWLGVEIRKLVRLSDELWVKDMVWILVSCFV